MKQGFLLLERWTTRIALVLACIAWDTLRSRRLHPAFVSGGLLVLLSWPLRLALAQTEAWQRFAHWLID